MPKLYKIIILILLIICPINLNAHVQHYESLNRIEFDIYRNNQHIGKHTFSFVRQEIKLEVESEINFEF